MYFWYCMISNKDQETLTKKVRLCRTLSSAHGILQAKKKKNTGVGSHSLLQGIFPDQVWNPGLPHCYRILYHLNHR